VDKIGAVDDLARLEHGSYRLPVSSNRVPSERPTGRRKDAWMSRGKLALQAPLVQQKDPPLSSCHHPLNHSKSTHTTRARDGFQFLVLEKVKSVPPTNRNASLLGLRLRFIMHMPKPAQLIPAQPAISGLLRSALQGKGLELLQIRLHRRDIGRV